VPCGLGTACVASWTESEKRTKMQFWEIKDWNAIRHLDCFENNKTETGLFWKLELDTSAIKCKIWTELQFLKILGLKCKK